MTGIRIGPPGSVIGCRSDRGKDAHAGQPPRCHGELEFIGPEDIYKAEEVLEHSRQSDRFDAACACAERTLCDHWNCVVAVAEALYAQGELTGRVIEALVDTEATSKSCPLCECRHGNLPCAMRIIPLFPLQPGPWMIMED